MDIACTACDQTLTVTKEQIGQSIRCPACKAVLQVRSPDVVDSTTMVICPGCAGKLAIPDSVDASTFRCPKCAIHLATQQPEPPQATVDIWESAENAGHAGGGASAAFDMVPDGFGEPSKPPADRPVVTSSTQWKKNTAYSSKVGSVVPGVLLLIHVSIGLLINVVQFFYAMGFSDELMAEEEVQGLRTVMIVSSVLGSLYLMVMAAGSLQMIFRQRLWLCRLACILAVLPSTALVCGLQWICLTSLLYVWALMAGIWGLVVLFGHHARRPAPA